MVAAPFFRTLEVFLANGTGAGTATAFAAHGFLSLRELELAYNALSDAAVGALARSKAVTKLTRLNLNDNPFGPAGTEALAGADVPQLEHLDLCRVACGRRARGRWPRRRTSRATRSSGISEDRTGAAGREALRKRFTDDVMMFTT